MNDPIVQEVRQHRMDHTTRFRGDLVAICADLRAIQVASGHRVVRLAFRRPEPNQRLHFTARPAPKVRPPFGQE